MQLYIQTNGRNLIKDLSILEKLEQFRIYNFKNKSREAKDISPIKTTSSYKYYSYRKAMAKNQRLAQN